MSEENKDQIEIFIPRFYCDFPTRGSVRMAEHDDVEDRFSKLEKRIDMLEGRLLDQECKENE